MDVQVGEVGHGKSPSLAVSRVYRVVNWGLCVARTTARAEVSVCAVEMSASLLVQMYRRSGTPRGNCPLLSRTLNGSTRLPVSPVARQMGQPGREPPEMSAPPMWPVERTGQFR